jgi:hypothetical protein
MSGDIASRIADFLFDGWGVHRHQHRRMETGFHSHRPDRNGQNNSSEK